MNYFWIVSATALLLALVTLGTELSTWASNVAIVSAIIGSSYKSKDL